MPTILLVEDEEGNRDMLVRRLRRNGFVVASAVNGEEALDRVRTEPPDLVLMDLRLDQGGGSIDGYEATRLLKAAAQTRAIPIIALTAYAMVGEREKALEAGCDDYDVKPVDLPRLLDKIQALLRGKPNS